MSKTTHSTRRSGDDRAAGGRWVAERAFRQIRFVALALIVITAFGYRPTAALSTAVVALTAMFWRTPRRDV